MLSGHTEQMVLQRHEPWLHARDSMLAIEVELDAVHLQLPHLMVVKHK